MRRLMSSTKWPPTRTGTGILSPQPEENPHWWNANMVFIPYCSSDVWSGATPKKDNCDYAFMGSLIIKEVVNELLTKGLDNAKVLLLAGSSAGGTGVLLNVDHVAEQLESQGHRGVQVRGLADSGWFLDNKQYKFTDCLDTISCAPTEAIKRGIRYWGGLVPESCRQAHVGEEWNCFFGYKVYPTLKSPVFVVQWLFDEAQLTVDNIHLTGQPVHEGQWRYIQSLGQELRSTLRDVPAMFAPACLSHELITRTYWMEIQVKGTSLPRALHCWDRSLQDINNNTTINGSHGNHNHQKHKTPPMRGCPLHLIDSCPWPHCNPTCPTIRDQLTGQEMSVIQFLKHMGFDVQKMAQQQGMDPRKLLGMLSNGN
ncbi:inactive palmitoleoyl-protein carboxylesterase notum1b isoform X2 [Thunnus albacares]|nr:inactive palmitoleoyl-protein carboxylesterase notum1b isoform X2 [Thunnus maccoyii]XP_042287279.1 inactive palmitoleoyl-protein carboxylesterase notum1b isoform X2 [Thunnus maccoyii]XP_042287289.1 inactive palmitoleoyl-protein carboxylesterase notum1b isoform X2 [Thunnus maccoyii]XP_044202065.1 inactive palmitoleoyl-protein carboxylesterase notum1b isoform X2 [Thunnus albacares]XP_044202066.1 inactive palmitoleoyl-protein carboxylesterase notum1b isoform X2 [Thunnus albacares]